MPRGTRAEPGTCAYPADGAYRVAENPTHLPTGPWPRGEGPNRYDDPLGRYSVRYLSETLGGCLKEKLAQFRRQEEAERRIAAAHRPPAVRAEDEDEDLDIYEMPPGPDHGPDDGLLPFLAVLRIARIRVRSRLVPFVDVACDATVHFLDKHQRVRTILGVAAVRRATRDRRRRSLTAAMLTDVDSPRELTQAVSRALFEDRSGFAGLAFPSCVDPTERCWAVYGRTRVSWDDDGKPLLGSATDALVAAAAIVGVVLPTAATA